MTVSDMVAARWLTEYYEYVVEHSRVDAAFSDSYQNKLHSHN